MRPDSLRIVHLMADYSLGYNALFFGQFPLLRTFAARWRTIALGDRRIAVEQIFAGAEVAGEGALRTGDPTEDANAYRTAVEELLTDGEPVVVFSHFIHKDAAAFAALFPLRRAHPNLRIVVVLHCTREEYLGPRSPALERARPRRERTAQRALAFRRALCAACEEGAVDRFVAVGAGARDSFLQGGEIPALPADRTVLIPNGVDPERFDILPPAARAEQRRRLAIPQGFVVGCTNRWTHTKGAAILEALLDRLERGAERFPVSFLFPAILIDQLADFLRRAPGRYPALFSRGRLRCYLDVSGLVHGPLGQDLEVLHESFMARVRAQPAEVRQVIETSFLGLLESPVHQLLDAYLRPSLAEAFGLGTVEASLCGIPVVASDRGGCEALVPPAYQVSLEPVLDVAGSVDGAADAAVEVAAERFEHLLHRLADDPLQPQELRQRMVGAGYTADHMVESYGRLVREIL
jgi:glycosyltransferase involved in cell wall biosynthesis